MEKIERCSIHRDREVLPACWICHRIQIEQEIVTRTVDALLAAGYAMNVDNGGGCFELERFTRDRATILQTMMQTGEDLLVIRDEPGEVGRDKMTIQHPSTWHNRGWVRFIYGNGGWDVINDFTSGLVEKALEPVDAYVKSIEG